MGKFTYEQFVKWCEHWDMTVEEGYRAMCFTANIIGQNFDNSLECLERIENNPYGASENVKKRIKTRFENSQKLVQLFLRLDEEVFDVLETYADTHEDE